MRPNIRTLTLGTVIVIGLMLLFWLFGIFRSQSVWFGPNFSSSYLIYAFGAVGFLLVVLAFAQVLDVEKSYRLLIAPVIPVFLLEPFFLLQEYQFWKRCHVHHDDVLIHVHGCSKEERWWPFGDGQILLNQKDGTLFGSD